MQLEMSLDHYSLTRLYEFVDKLHMYLVGMEVNGTNTFIYLNGQEYTKDFLIKMISHVQHQIYVREFEDTVESPCQDIRNLL